MKKAIGTALFLVLLIADGRAVWGQTPDSVARAMGRLMEEQLQSEIFEKRDSAIRTLGCLGLAAKGTIPALTHAARNDPIGEVRFAALRVLGSLGPEARSALPAIREALNDEDHLVRVHAADALAILEPGASDLAALTLAHALRYSLREPGEVPAFFVFGALRRLGPKGRVVEPALMEMARTADLLTRLDAICVLGVMGSDSAEVVTLLMGAMKDRTPLYYLRPAGRGVAFLLSPLVGGQFPDDRDTLRLLRYELRDVVECGRLTRECCAGYLGRLGPKALPAVPALRGALDDTCPAVRRAVRQALQQIEARP